MTASLIALTEAGDHLAHCLQYADAMS